MLCSKLKKSKSSYSEPQVSNSAIISASMESGVGKSSIVLRFVTGDFKEDHESTLGAAFMAKMLVHGGKSAKFQVPSLRAAVP